MPTPSFPVAPVELPILPRRLVLLLLRLVGLVRRGIHVARMDAADALLCVQTPVVIVEVGPIVELGAADRASIRIVFVVWHQLLAALASVTVIGQLPCHAKNPSNGVRSPARLRRWRRHAWSARLDLAIRIHSRR